MRRITVTLDIAIETEAEASLDRLTTGLMEEVEHWVPTVPLPWDRKNGTPPAVVTRVALSRVSEQ